jgi:hypothetical protein
MVVCLALKNSEDGSYTDVPLVNSANVFITSPLKTGSI